MCQRYEAVQSDFLLPSFSLGRAISTGYGVGGKGILLFRKFRSFRPTEYE
jgi:hypothetical protein